MCIVDNSREEGAIKKAEKGGGGNRREKNTFAADSIDQGVINSYS